MSKEHPRLFISYSHDSPEHSSRVLELANKLRLDGVDAWIDQFESFPEMGWPRWMLGQLEASDYVVAIASPAYKRRFEGTEEPGKSGKGRGVSWEGLLLTQALYESSGGNKKIIPVILDDSGGVEDVPLPLRPFVHISIPEDYEVLLRQVFQRPKTIPAPLGAAPELQPKSIGTVASGTLSPLVEVQLETSADEARQNINKLEKALREITGSNDIFITEIKEGSARLQISGDSDALARLEKLINENRLSDLVGLSVVRVTRLEPIRDVGPPWLDQDVLKEVFKVADKLGLSENGVRVTLLGGLPSKVRNTLPVASSGAAQMLADIRHLNDLPRLADGSVPIHTWLETAELLKQDFQDAAVFHQAVIRLRS